MNYTDRNEVQRIVTRKALEVVLLVMLLLGAMLTSTCILNTRISALEAQVKELKEQSK